MNHKALALTAALLVVSGAFLCLSVCEDSSAVNQGTKSMIVYRGQSATYTWTEAFGYGYEDVGTHELEFYFSAIGNASQRIYGPTVTYNAGSMTIYCPANGPLGTYEINAEDWTTEDDLYDAYITFADQPNYTVTYNGNGGSVSTGSQTVSGGSVVSLPSASKSYCTFSGWFTAASGGTRVGGAGDSYTVTGNITLYAQYNVIPVSITTTHATEYMVQGSSFSYTVGTNPADAAISVSGASWLSVSNKTVTGVPTVSSAPAGTYHVTVTASYGTQSAVQTFDIVVAEKLIFESVPTGGIIAVPA